MLETALYVAMACAVCGALARNRTAWVLLASVGFCLLLNHFRVPFNPNLWLLFDLAVIVVVVRPQMTVQDILIVALFIPAWACYLLPDDERYAGSMLATTAQLLLCAPILPVSTAVSRFAARVKASAQHFDQFRWVYVFLR